MPVGPLEWLERYVDHPAVLLLSIAIAVPVMLRYWQWFFGNAEESVQDLKDALVPDLWAALKGRYWEGEWAELKLASFLLLGLAFVAALYKIGVDVFY